MLVLTDHTGRAVAFFAPELHPNPPNGAFAIDDAVYAAWIGDTVGQRWDGAQLVAVALPPAPPVRIIRSLAFRMRLPEARRQAVTAAAFAAAGAGQPAALTFLLDQASSVTTDLDDPRVEAGVAALAQAGVITAAEAAALLADGTPEEAR